MSAIGVVSLGGWSCGQNPYPSPDATNGAPAPRGARRELLVLTAGPVRYFYGRHPIGSAGGRARRPYRVWRAGFARPMCGTPRRDALAGGAGGLFRERGGADQNREGSVGREPARSACWHGCGLSRPAGQEMTFELVPGMAFEDLGHPGRVELL